MSDDVLKNPNRKDQQQIVKASKYVPEWQRLGKEPMVQENKPSDVMFLGKNRPVERPSMPGAVRPVAVAAKPVQVSAKPVQAPGQEHAPVSPPNTKKQDVDVTPPHQTKVSVGRNANWFGTVENGSQPVDQNHILYDSVDVSEVEGFASKPQLEVEASASEQEVVNSDFSRLSSNEYGVFVKDILVARTSVLSEAETIIESILFEDIPGFVNVTIDDVMLIRRLSLKVGVLAVSE